MEISHKEFITILKKKDKYEKMKKKLRDVKGKQRHDKNWEKPFWMKKEMKIFLRQTISLTFIFQNTNLP